MYLNDHNLFCTLDRPSMSVQPSDLGPMSNPVAPLRDLLPMYGQAGHPLEEDNYQEEVPNRLDTSGVSQFLTVGKDLLTASYKGSGQHPNDVGSIRANAPVLANQKIYYYEITVLNDGEHGKIGVGFADKDFKLQGQPGWDPNSYGYHGDDGHKFSGSGQGQEYAATFGKGDVVGAGLHFEKQEIFFTKNGKYLKVAFDGVKTVDLYPTIGLHSKGENVEVNLGGKPFRFDLEGMIMEENDELQRQIRASSISTGQVHHIVRMYLLHYGYADTLEALDEVAGLSKENSRLEELGGVALNIRREVRRHILQGKIDSVIQILQENFPGLLSPENPHQEVRFCLYCQKYLELVRAGSVSEAVEYAQQVLMPFRSLSQECHKELINVMAVVAYLHPHQSPLKYLLTPARREMVADVINAAILVHSHRGEYGPESVLEKLLRALVACHRQIHAENQNQGEVFRLRDHLLRPVS